MTRVMGKRALACGVAVLALSVASAAFAQQRTFNLPANEAVKAIPEFARQAGLQIVAPADDLKGVRTPAIRGQQDARAALKVLLAGTGLVVVADEGSVITLRRAGAAGPQAPGAQAAPPEPSVVEAVVVTGTNIQGVAPAGQKLLAIDRREIDRSGYSSAQELLRSLPQNFGGVATESSFASIGGHQGDSVASARQSAINLRGLGAESTLILVDGRRMVAAGGKGVIADVSTIPLSAVERIEILPDGASALYGSDAVGGVVNFILKRNFEGAETRLRYGGVTSGGQREAQASQTVGHAWTGGSLLLSGQVRQRDALYAHERSRSDGDLRPYGGSDFRVATCNPGTITVAGVTYAIPRGQDGTALTPASFTAGTRNLCARLPYNTYFPDEKQWNVIGRVTQQVTDALSLHVDGAFNDRRIESSSSSNTATLTVRNTNAFYVNPTGGTGPITLTYDFFPDLGPTRVDDKTQTWNVSVGGELKLWAGWTARFDTGPARSKEHQFQVAAPDTAILNQVLADGNRATAFNPFGDGSHTNPATLARLRNSTTTTFDVDSQLWLSTGLVSGPIYALPAGQVRLALGGERRDLKLDTASRRFVSTGTTTTLAAFKRDVTAGFGELFVPLFGEANAQPFLQTLELSLASRYEDYSDFGDNLSSRIGATWGPIEAVRIRASWSQSFKAPVLADLSEANNASFLIDLPDPLSTTPARTTATLALQGGNAALQPETAESWTVGFDVAPPALPGLKVSASYFHIDYEDRIGLAPGGTALVALNDPFIIRSPTAAQRQAACDGAIFAGNFSQTVAGTCLTANVPILDLRQQNLASLEERGADFSVTYAWNTGLGYFTAGLNGTYLFDYKIKAVAGAPAVEVVNTEADPLRLKVRASLAWGREGFGAAAYVNYANAYDDTTVTPNKRIDSWTTIDLNLSYAFSEGAAWGLHGTKVGLSVRNAFDKDPPFFNGNATSGGYDSANANFQGRFVAIDLTKAW